MSVTIRVYKTINFLQTENNDLAKNLKIRKIPNFQTNEFPNTILQNLTTDPAPSYLFFVYIIIYFAVHWILSSTKKLYWRWFFSSEIDQNFEFFWYWLLCWILEILCGRTLSRYWEWNVRSSRLGIYFSQRWLIMIDERYHMAHIICAICYGTCEMNHIIWVTWYGFVMFRILWKADVIDST